MNPIYQKALDAVWSNINGGMSHPNDFGKVVDMFNRLLDAGKVVESTDQIKNYLKTQHNVPDVTAQNIQMIYEVLQVSKEKHSYWDDDFIDCKILTP